MSVCVVLGSAFSAPQLAGVPLEPRTIATRFGAAVVHVHPQSTAHTGRYVLFRHGVPHARLPHQVNHRANVAALQSLGVTRVLLTTSAGVMDPVLPLFEPMLLTDLFMPENRLPDGTACTMFTTPEPAQAHLVLNDGLFSTSLGRAVRDMAAQRGISVAAPARAVFAYVQGPRTKTAAENAWYAAQGVQLNSMSVGPEVVLMNECGMAVAALAVGHKYSVPATQKPLLDAQEPEQPRDTHGQQPVLDENGIARSLQDSHVATAAIAAAFLKDAPAAAFANTLYRF